MLIFPKHPATTMHRDQRTLAGPQSSLIGATNNNLEGSLGRRSLLVRSQRLETLHPANKLPSKQSSQTHKQAARVCWHVSLQFGPTRKLAPNASLERRHKRAERARLPEPSRVRFQLHLGPNSIGELDSSLFEPVGAYGSRADASSANKTDDRSIGGRLVGRRCRNRGEHACLIWHNNSNDQTRHPFDSMPFGSSLRSTEDARFDSIRIGSNRISRVPMTTSLRNGFESEIAFEIRV